MLSIVECLCPFFSEGVMALRRMLGRSVIYTNESNITRDNVLQVLEEALRTHFTNRVEIDYLYNYYKGNQPILNRVKHVREEINNKIVENHAMEIVDFKKGYVFGEPVQYVRRGEHQGVADKIGKLNEFMFAEDKASKDQELAEWFYVCGTGYRMILPDEDADPEADLDDSPFEIDILDPRNTFVVYHNGFGKNKVMGVTSTSKYPGETVYSVYTKECSIGLWTRPVLWRKDPTRWGHPIIEYPANNARMGSFEAVLPLLDALNTVISNRIDGIEQLCSRLLNSSTVTLMRRPSKLLKRWVRSKSRAGVVKRLTLTLLVKN